MFRLVDESPAPVATAILRVEFEHAPLLAALDALATLVTDNSREIAAQVHGIALARCFGGWNCFLCLCVAVYQLAHDELENIRMEAEQEVRTVYVVVLSLCIWCAVCHCVCVHWQDGKRGLCREGAPHSIYVCAFLLPRSLAQAWELSEELADRGDNNEVVLLLPLLLAPPHPLWPSSLRQTCVQCTARRLLGRLRRYAGARR